MRIFRLANLFEHKYKIATTVPTSVISAEIRDGIAAIYKKFMDEYNGSIAQLKKVYDLPYLEEIQTVFSALVSQIDTLSIPEIVKLGNGVMDFIEKSRVMLNDVIKTNVDDPAFTAAFMRKRLASTVDKSLEAIQFLLKRQLSKIQDNLSEVKLEKPPEHQKRRRMTQTPTQLQSLVLEYGDQYGVNGMEDWGKIVHKDYELAYDLMTAFLGHRRGHKKVKAELADRVKELLGRK